MFGERNRRGGNSYSYSHIQTEPRELSGQYSYHSLSSNSNSNSNSGVRSPFVGGKNKVRGFIHSNSSSPAKPLPKRLSSKVNKKLIDALASSSAYDHVELFDSGSNVQAQISIAAANSVNKYVLLPQQSQLSYNQQMKEISKHSVSISLPEDYNNFDDDGEGEEGGSDDEGEKSGGGG